MIVQDLIEDCSVHVHDDNYREISLPTWLHLVRSAARHARSSGWLIQHEDDESLTIAAATWEYTVPSKFAYIYEIWLEEVVNSASVYVLPVPSSHWDLRLNGSAPQLTFNTRTALIDGRKLKVIGQRRPTIYTDLSQDIDAGMEGFMLERTLYYAWRYVAPGSSELARWRQQMAMHSWQSSEALLLRHPQEFRVMPSSKVVPGRA